MPAQRTSKYTPHYDRGLEQLFKEISLAILGKYIKLICKEMDLDKIMETTIDTEDKGNGIIKYYKWGIWEAVVLQILN